MVSDNMDNISHRAVIHCLSLEGLTPKEIHADIVVILGENAPSYRVKSCSKYPMVGSPLMVR